MDLAGVAPALYFVPVPSTRSDVLPHLVFLYVMILLTAGMLHADILLRRDIKINDEERCDVKGGKN